MLNRALLLVWFMGCCLTAQASAQEAIEIAKLPVDQKVSFTADVLPVLKKNCLACHNTSRDEGGVNLESVAAMKASDVEEVLVPKKPDTSRLFLVAARLDEPVMPPEDNDVGASALNGTELALLKRWIDRGAIDDTKTQTVNQDNWQPIPPALKTVYASSMTSDGRLAGVGFANQVRLFGSQSATPLATLQRYDSGKPQPAHTDFVQDILVTDDGTRIVSTGFRNVKMWHLASLENRKLPRIRKQDAIAIAVNSTGSHIASCSAKGELQVAAIGNDRFEWMRAFDAPEGTPISNENTLMTLADTGDVAAIAVGSSLVIVQTDVKKPSVIDVAETISALRIASDHHIACATEKGNVFAFERKDDVWESSTVNVSDQKLEQLHWVDVEKRTLFTIDAQGGVASVSLGADPKIQSIELPEPAANVAINSDGTRLWVTTRSGKLGTFDSSKKEWKELSQYDPAAAYEHRSRQWEVAIGTRLVSAVESELKATETEQKAEQASLDKIAEDIKAKETDTSEKQKAYDQSASALDAATEAESQAVKNRDAVKAKRATLMTESQKLDARIKELEAQLAEARTNKETMEKEMAALPSDAALDEAVTKAADSLKKASEAKAKANDALEKAKKSLTDAQATKQRSQARAEGIAKEVSHRQQRVADEKALQEHRKQAEQTAKSHAEATQAASGAVTLLGNETWLITKADKNAFQLWSASGDWIATLNGLPAELQAAQLFGNAVLAWDPQGLATVYQFPAAPWKLEHTLGSVAGESPFADRVLCVDISPDGRLLATGGGAPSRSGEIHLYNLEDFSLVRKIENPHGDTVLSLRFSPDGSTLASGGADRLIKLWNVKTGDAIKSLEGHTHHVNAIAWDVTGREIASGSADQTIKVWNVSSGKASRTISDLKTEVTALTYLGTENRIGVVGGDSYFRVYRTDNGRRETNAKVAESYLYSIGNNHDGTEFVVGGADGKAKVVDKSGKLLREYQ